MAKLYDAIEIGLSRAELRQALVQWLHHKAMLSNFNVTDVSLHPTAEYVVRFKVEPPLEKAQQEKIVQMPECKAAAENVN